MLLDCDLQFLAVGCIVGAIGVWLISKLRFAKKLPPGPLIPVMRNLYIELSNNPNKMLEFQNYGPICSFRFFNVLAIMANNNEAVRALFVESADSTSYRWQTNVTHSKLDFHGGVISSEGPIWREHRTFVLSTLRKFGFSKYEEPIQDQLCQLVQHIREKFARPNELMEPTTLFSRATANVINKMVYGFVSDLEDEQLAKVACTTLDFFGDVEFNGSILVEVLGNAAFYLPGDWLHAKRQRRNLDILTDYIDERINEHIRKVKQNEIQEADCLLDAYLLEWNNRETTQPGQTDFSVTQIRTVLFDLLIAGMETTSTTLRWCVLLLAHFPEVQRRVQHEIDEVLEGRVPNLADRSRLVYTEAVLHEVERFATVAPLALPHKASADFTFQGYHIPKNAMLFANIYACHHDQRWPDPSRFNPVNFYDESTHSLRNLDLLIPFSVGRRSCLGESLAKQELFIFFAGLLQAFEFSASAQEPLPSYIQANVTLARGPLRYRVQVKSRSDQVEE